MIIQIYILLLLTNIFEKIGNDLNDTSLPCHADEKNLARSNPIQSCLRSKIKLDPESWMVAETSKTYLI